MTKGEVKDPCNEQHLGVYQLIVDHDNVLNALMIFSCRLQIIMLLDACPEANLIAEAEESPHFYSHVECEG